MARMSTAMKMLSGQIKAPSIKIGNAPTDKVRMGGVPDQAPAMDKAKSLLAGVPMSVRGKKPRLGSL